jgi:hypothetical protein
MNGIVLRCAGPNEVKEIVYQYKCREESVPEATRVEAIVPQIKTRVSMLPVSKHLGGYFREGYAFSPMFTLGLTGNLSNNQEIITCLKLEKAD